MEGKEPKRSDIEQIIDVESNQREVALRAEERLERLLASLDGRCSETVEDDENVSPNSSLSRIRTLQGDVSGTLDHIDSLIGSLEDLLLA